MPAVPIAEANGIRLAYEERGSGEPLVLVSGIGMQLVANRDVGLSTARSIPGATFRLIEGWGHDLPEGVLDVLVEAIAGHARAHPA
jgi:hypothetical protein